ncbi:MAG: hypothetical protein KKH99_14505 [Proteobacteria bacterium]|nr:hypothetical protein [Pseudomonadota bacterium]
MQAHFANPRKSTHIPKFAKRDCKSSPRQKEIFKISSVELDPATVETNIILFGVKGLTANEIISRVRDSSENGNSLLLSVGKKYLARAVMHLNVSDEDVEEAVTLIRKVF